jgi:micrococcal nuclease
MTIETNSIREQLVNDQLRETEKYEAQKLKGRQAAMDIIRDTERRNKNHKYGPIISAEEAKERDLAAEERQAIDNTDRSEDSNQSIIDAGLFRFNDQVIDIPPEKISIHTDEYEDSRLLLRESTPVSAQTGRKRVRLVVEFPVDVANGYSQLARMITQIKKTPIATIENEKIRAELLGEVVVGSELKNIGVVVDNITGYVDDDFPTLIRCTLQMTWFNHFPYVNDIRYINEVKGKKLWQKSADSNLYREFYMEGTGDLKSGLMYNDPNTGHTKDSLVIMYKEFKKVAEAISMESNIGGSALGRMSVTQNPATERIVGELKKRGWHFAEEDEDKQPETLDGVFYRWRSIEIPFTDFDSSGALILQGMSFSLNTNPTYIQMEQYSMPTIQFLGGSVSDIRAIVYAGAEHKSYQDKTPISTSKKLSKLMSVINKISSDRLRFPKYAKENHLLISHPIAKLMKFGGFGADAIDFNTVDENDQVVPFAVDNFLPVIISSNSSNTMGGLPFASRLQLDFKETRLSKHKNNIVYQGDSGSRPPKDMKKIALSILRLVYSNTEIRLDKDNNFVVSERSIVYPRATGPEEETKGAELARALNVLRKFDKGVIDLNSAVASKIFQAKGSEYQELLKPNKVQYGRNGFTPIGGNSNPNPDGIFSSAWLEVFVGDVFMKFSQALINGKPWVRAYVPLLEDYGSMESADYSSLFKDMKLPKGKKDPAYYFVDGSDRQARYRHNILTRMPKNYKNYESNLAERMLNPEWIKNVDSEIAKDLQPVTSKSMTPAYNAAVTEKGIKTGVVNIHDPNSSNFRIMSAQRAVADSSPPTHSLSQAYPTFQVKLFSDKYNFFQKLSVADVSADRLQEEQQVDLLDMFELSSIMDIRVIKDEYEAADAMVIRVAASKKELVAKEGRDPFYNKDNISITDIIETIKKSAGEAVDGISTASIGVSHNLEEMGLKEGVRIKAYMGNGMDSGGMQLEFSGKVAAISGRDVVEIYCLGNGHELIQDTKGFNQDTSDKNVYSLNSDTTDLIGELLSNADEVRSFGNVKPEVFKNLTANLPASLGGVSALDNIYAPNMWPDFDGGDFIGETVSGVLSSVGFLGGLGVTFGGSAFVGAAFGIIGFKAVLAISVGALIYETLSSLGRKLNPCSFTVYQQTIWDVLQELTLRHPGYIATTVPFDNRSTIYFGEPDGIYFSRGQKSAAEKTMKILAGKKSKTLLKNPTLREVYSEISSISKDNNVQEARYPILLPNAQQQLKATFRDSSEVESMTLLNMQKAFRSYHLVTSQNDIIKNNIEASSVDVANSVQVYGPVNNDNVNTDGKTWFSDYKLTERMKADDDLDADKINNKVFTFHNAHDEDSELELPQKYAVAVLCKELGNSYKGYIEILGRSGVKPHDIVIVQDTYNNINGPIGVRRVIQTMSPRTGWRTRIYPKFLAFPQSTTGAFQMKAIMKAARYWLGVETQLFYSNMEGFNTHERPDGDKKFNELVESISRLTNNKETDDHGDSITKEEMARHGESVIGRDAGFAAATAATQIGGQSVARALFNPVTTFDTIVDGASSIAGNGSEIRQSLSTASQTRKIADGRKVFTAGGKMLMSGGKLGFTAGKRLLGGVGGFVVASLLENAADSFISYMKYRQPITLFPLSKDGQPWLAGLNGFKENTVLEHLDKEITGAGDKLGMTMKLVNYFLEEWTGDSPIDVGVGGTYEVTNAYDGDTITIKNGSKDEKIRVLGYNTGELKPSSSRPDEVIGPNEKYMAEKARERIRELISQGGNRVQIKRQGTDKYKRTLAKVYIGGKNVADIMKEEGYGLNYPKSFQKDYSKTLPAHLKTNKEAIAAEREKDWANQRKKNEEFKKSQRSR